MTTEELYLLHERIAIKMDSGIPKEVAEKQARKELGYPEIPIVFKPARKSLIWNS